MPARGMSVQTLDSIHGSGNAVMGTTWAGSKHVLAEVPSSELASWM